MTINLFPNRGGKTKVNVMEKKLKLRYVVEGNFSATFTASKRVKDTSEAHRIVMSLGLLNLKAGYKKYSRPILYDEHNKRIESFKL